MSRNIKSLPEKERPREKLQQKGPEALSDVELIAILLGSGTKGHDVMKVSSRILKVLDGNAKQPTIEELQQIEGVGFAKATLISAALEFARRRIRPEGIRISTPADVLPLIQNYADRKQEHFICISINGANEVMKTRVVSVGLVNKTQVHPREVFADPITDRAAAIIDFIVHNQGLSGLPHAGAV
ncbi:MAG: hypothetical protein HZA16_06930 [Nitrospirae bacterium]|nr:hypothetical protein [Nitrospirota bacterium]